MFFDTNIIILFLGDLLDKNLLDVLKEKTLMGKAYISHIVLGEVLAYSGYTENQVKEIRKILYLDFKVIKIDNEIMELASKIARDRKNKTGKKLKLIDSIIAATAIVKNLKLATLDQDDFSEIDGLNVFS